MQTKKRLQQAKEILESVSDTAPIYLARTPKGKRFLQMSRSSKANNDQLSASIQVDSLRK